MTDSDAFEIEPHLPCHTDYGPGPDDDTSFLYGAKIVRIGAADLDCRSVLAIEYDLQGVTRTVLLDYSELGLEFASVSPRG